MKVIRTAVDTLAERNSVVTVGTFDGLHCGHRAIVQYLLERWQARGLEPVVVTFDPHPQVVVRQPGRQPIRLLTTTDEKLSLLEQAGIPTVVLIAFTEEFRKTVAADFVQRYLVEGLGVQELVVGYDHAFGKDREGTYATLRDLGRTHDFAVSRIDPVFAQDTEISSTRIRAAIVEGAMETAAAMLGAPYIVTGPVIPGDGRGRTLGYPTANIDICEEEKLIPKDGTYIATVNLGGTIQPAMVNIGNRPTFAGQHRTIEAHVLQFQGDLYGQTLEIQFHKRLRDERKFANVLALQQQIAQDEQATIAYFATS